MRTLLAVALAAVHPQLLAVVAGVDAADGAAARAHDERLGRRRRGSLVADALQDVAVGDADPVNAGLALLDPLVARYRAAGLDVTLHVYPGARHEVFNETNRDQVLDDVVEFIHAALARIS